MGHELLGRPREPRAHLHVVGDLRHPRGVPAAALRGRGELLRRDAGNEAERAEHLHVLLVPRRDLAHRALATLREVIEDAEAQALAELVVEPRAVRGVLERVDRLLGHRRGAAADEAPDAVLHHEVEAARARAHHGLPRLDGMHGARHECQLLQLVAAVRNVRRQRVVLALVGERLLAERLHDDVDLLLEQLAVGFGVQHRCPERLHLACVVAAADTEDRAALGQDVGRREVFGQPQRMPHGRDVEAAADLQARGEMREVDGGHQEVRDDLIALVLEVVLGQPERPVAVLVHAARDRLGLVEDGREVRVRVAALVRGRRRLSHVPQIDVARVDVGELRDHDRSVSPRAGSVRVVSKPEWTARISTSAPSLMVSMRNAEAATSARPPLPGMRLATHARNGAPRGLTSSTTAPAPTASAPAVSASRRIARPRSLSRSAAAVTRTRGRAARRAERRRAVAPASIASSSHTTP